jgi:hypothetical protein
MNNKKYAIFAVLLALGALEFSQIEVPADFDEPIRYRFNVFFFRGLRNLVKVI